MGFNITTVDHVVLAVSDLDAAIDTWQNTYGLTLSERHQNPGGFEAALFPMENSLLELVQPIDDNPRNPVRLQIERKGEGLFILSLGVDVEALQAAIAAFGDERLFTFESLLAALDELDDLAVHQVNARDDHKYIFSKSALSLFRGLLLPADPRRCGPAKRPQVSSSPALRA